MRKKENRRTGDEPANNRDAKGRFVAGNRANPGGRPKSNEELKEALRRLSPAAIDTYRKVLEDPEASNKDKIRVAQDILDRILGKPQQSISLDDIDRTIKITFEGGEGYGD